VYEKNPAPHQVATSVAVEKFLLPMAYSLILVTPRAQLKPTNRFTIKKLEKIAKSKLNVIIIQAISYTYVYNIFFAINAR
jgi:hypothetical protein